MAKKKDTKSVDAPVENKAIQKPVADKAVAEPAEKKLPDAFVATVQTLSMTCSGGVCRIIGVNASGVEIDQSLPSDGSIKVSIGV